MKEDDYYNAGTTLPDYQNFRNVLFHQWEELNNAVVEFRTCKRTEFRIYQRVVIKSYLRFFSQINDKSKLAHLDKLERNYLIKYYNDHKLITVSIAKNILDITRKLMSEYGVFNLESGGEDELY